MPHELRWDKCKRSAEKRDDVLFGAELSSPATPEMLSHLMDRAEQCGLPRKVRANITVGDVKIALSALQARSFRRKEV